MPTRSETTALEFYERVGPAGLAERTTSDRDAQSVSQIAERLPQACRILDLGCGYGHIALPLAGSGHRIVALDLCQNLLGQGRDDALRAALPISWLRATMTSIPLAASSLEVVLCLGTTFFELLDPLEQTSALAEVLRVLRPGEWALVDGPAYREATPDEIAS